MKIQKVYIQQVILFGNVVYEGELRNLSHVEILSLFADVILCFIGAEEVEIMEEEAPYDDKNEQYKYYKPHNYKIYCKRKMKVKGQVPTEKAHGLKLLSQVASVQMEYATGQ